MVKQAIFCFGGGGKQIETLRFLSCWQQLRRLRRLLVHVVPKCMLQAKQSKSRCSINYEPTDREHWIMSLCVNVKHAVHIFKSVIQSEL